MEQFFTVENDGQKIISTNYWESDYAKNGYYFLSLNAGCYRLLVPKNRRDQVKEMKTAKEVVISRGSAMSMMPPKHDAFEILFEDGTDSPFVLTISHEQMDRVPADKDLGWKGTFAVYEELTEPVLRFERTYYRKVKSLPYLKPTPDK